MSSDVLRSSSKISTQRRCDNCGVTINQVIWKQCRICNVFDLCASCDEDYLKLLPGCRNRHQLYHQQIGIHGTISNDSLQFLLVEHAEQNGKEARANIIQTKLGKILKENKIQNDYEMSLVMDKLKQLETSTEKKELDQLNSLIARYQLQASQRNLRVLSLDGGGVRGYMPIKILAELVTQKYLPSVGQLHPDDPVHKELFRKAQIQLTDQFDYFVGTSTGGFIAFCLSMNVSILDIQEIYMQSSRYFKRNLLGPLICSKYNPSRIHRKIDEVINGIPSKNGTLLSAEHSTLLDIRNILNPDNIIDEQKAESIAPYRGNFSEFVDDKDFVEEPDSIDEGDKLHRIKSERVLLITAYNTTTNSMTIFNTSYSKHWNYRIADVLKATMAAPTYFPPYRIWEGKKVNGQYAKGDTSALYIDGGIFANDPELAALWAIRVQWKKTTNYHLLSIGTGCYNTTLSSSTWGGYLGWIFNKGFLVNTLMDATRSFIETIATNLAKFNEVKRMKLNYEIKKPMALDNGEFVSTFDREWEILKSEADFKALIYFYDKYITKEILVDK